MRVGLCCMTLNNINSNFTYWIHHHLNIVKIDFILLRKEFMNEILDTNILNIPKVIIIESDVIKNHYDSYEVQQYRQIDFVNRCIQKYCPMYQIDYLLHLDDDELLVIHKKWSDIHHYLKNLHWENGKTHLTIQNVEAILKRNTDFTNDDNIFKKTKFFKNCSREKCRGYSNGKSLANLSFCKECNGCHTFKGDAIYSNIKDIMILHYDSIIFEHWEKKFKRLGTLSMECFKSIPFPFYKQSIKIMYTNDAEKKKKFWSDKISDCSHPMDITKEYNILY